jgi:hypothetical protein
VHVPDLDWPLNARARSNNRFDSLHNDSTRLTLQLENVREGNDSCGYMGFAWSEKRANVTVYMIRREKVKSELDVDKE